MQQLFSGFTPKEYTAGSLRLLGIDLGTTNSTVAELIWEPCEPEALRVRCVPIEQPTNEGNYTHILVPSVVAIREEQVFVGEGARRLRAQASAFGLTQNKDLFYECKNDIGCRRTYHRAPSGFRSAVEIGAKVLEFLYSGAVGKEEKYPVRRCVVTVPASFQMAQRFDTQKAALLANLSVSSGDLLDEPTAAFLDYICTYDSQFLTESGRLRNLVVFDFGGGTCDVAVFSIQYLGANQPLQIAPRSVSRYHRLGGGDIDAAIVHEILIPELVQQNPISTADLGFEEKKKIIEPAFLGVAEALKIGLCNQIHEQKKRDRYEQADKSQIVKNLPGIYTVKLREQTLSLTSPQLSAEQFEILLRDFLDQDHLYTRTTEYRLTCSIFSPLFDAIARAGLGVRDIDFCLLAGGSSLIPQVQEAVQKFFPRAQLLTYPDSDSIQTTVARGAAYHALSLALQGRGLIQTCCHDSIAIKTTTQPVELIPRGVSLPYPSTEEGRYEGLSVPTSAVLGKEVILKVELVAESDGRALFQGSWKIPGPVQQGTPLQLKYRLNENQILEMQLKLEGKEPFSVEIENPLTNVVNPQTELLKTYEIEEELKALQLSSTRKREKVQDLARAYVGIGQREKAIDLLKASLRSSGVPDAGILNQMGICYYELRNFEKAEIAYQQSILSDPTWDTAWFNLSLSLQKQAKYQQAKQAIDEAIKLECKAPYLVLRCQILKELEETKYAQQDLDKALKSFSTISTCESWEVGWYREAAQMAGDWQKLSEIETEQRRRAMSANQSQHDDQGEYPELR